jgi:hypothetical protein
VVAKRTKCELVPARSAKKAVLRRCVPAGTIRWNLWAEDLEGKSSPSPPRAGEHVMQKQFKQTTSLQERLAREAEQARARATSLPSGKERDALLRMARLAETASRIDAWLSSPGLRAPE